MQGYQAKIPNTGAERGEEREELFEKDGKDFEERMSASGMEMKPRAEKWSDSLEMMRECVEFLKENCKVWKRRTSDETKRIKYEERTRRLELVSEKRKRIVRNVKNLTKMETGELKMETKMKMELSEIRQNLRRYQREGIKTATLSAPEG